MSQPNIIAREGLTRSVPFSFRTNDQVSDEGDGLTLDGYGAVFDEETIIDSWEGTFREVIVRGAFRRTLKERTPKMQFDHGRHPLIGSIPIGAFDAGFPAEDDLGLHVVGRLSDNWLIQPVRDAIASQSIDGMSFRFSVVRDTWTTADGKKITDPKQIAEMIWKPPDEGMLLRTLTEVKLSEVGPVVWPAYEATSVGVRDGMIDLSRLHEQPTRELLARAVLLADMADGKREQEARPRSRVSAPARHTPLGVPVGSDGTPGEHRSQQIDSKDEVDLARRENLRRRVSSVLERAARLKD